MTTRLMDDGIRSPEAAERLGIRGRDVYMVLFDGELDGGPGRDGLVYFDEASIDAYLDRHGYGVVAETSNGTSNGSNDTAPDRGVQDGTSDPRNPSAEVQEDTGEDGPTGAYRAIDRFDGRYPRAWLLTIMRDAQVNRVRRKRPELIRDPEFGDRLLESQAPHDSAESVVVGEQFDATVEDAFEHLPEKYRRVVELVDLHGLSYQEAADALGVPIGTVMSRLHRARKRIRTRDEPFVATAWNRLKAFDQPDTGLLEFVDTYRRRGPERVDCPA